MARTVGIGHQDFEKVRVKNNFYIDKTDFIREWWEADDEVTLITRPRRFGKTLTMSMVEKFFSVNYAGRGKIFEGLSIWQDEKYRRLQGTFPVISLSFANVKEKDYVTTIQRISQIVTELYNDSRFLLEGDLLSEEEKEYFRGISMNMTEVTATMAIHRLSKFLYQYYGKKVIILLDEYDTPMQEAYVNGFWDELVAFTRSMFNAAFKTNPYLERAIMTGITRVSKESIFSDLNHLEVITTTSEKYAESFGFTEDEVFASLDEYGLSDRKDEVKRWYDGFTFGSRTDIYNPWSIINYLDKKRIGVYWANTSSNSLVGKLLQEGNKNVKQNFEELLQGGSLRMEVDEQIIYNQLSERKDAVWSLLLAGGYLKVAGMEYIERTGGWECSLMLTNREVKIMFEHMIRGWFGSYEDEYNDFIKAFLLGDLDAMNDYMNEVALATFSYFDTGKEFSKEEPERFYHGFVLGLMVDLNDRYVLTSNRESGFGRYDVMLEPRNPADDAMILEFKVFQPRKENDLQDTVESALHQIDDMRYEAALVEKGVTKEKIRKYGFAFRGKEVLIGGGY
ncbi:MAG: AAA family ATPase [Lachnospiraceae bacterium]|nr:AAA family ATPase [Lachnospiraceae bacterium]